MIENTPLVLIEKWEDFERVEYSKLKGEDRKTYRANLALWRDTAPRKVQKPKKDPLEDGRRRKTGIETAPAVREKLNTTGREVLDSKLNKTQSDAILLEAVDDFTIFAMLVGHIVSPSYKLYQMHLEIAHYLQEMENNNTLGAVFSAPPRSGKTKIIDIYAAWQIGKYPHLNHYIITYGEELSVEHTMQIRDILKSNTFKKIFPKVRIRKNVDSKIKLMTTQGGIIAALGRGSGISGKTMHRIYIDDLVKEAQEIRSPSVRDTLNDITSNILQRRVSGDDVPSSELTRIVVIGTRYFADDPIGEFMDIIKNKFNGPVVNFPAIAFEEMYSAISGKLWLEPGDYMVPERVNAGAVEIAQASPSYTPDLFQAVYMGVTMKDTVNFKKEWIKYKSEKELEAINTINFLFVDTAVTLNKSSDDTGFAIGMLDNRTGIVYVKAWGEKIGPKELIEKIFELHDKYGFKLVGMEKMMYSQGLEPFFKDEALRQNRLIRMELIPHGNISKEIRILGSLPGLYANGLFQHVEGETTKLEKQMFEYPKGLHDDVLDAVAGLATITGGEKEKQHAVGKIIKSPLRQNVSW